MSAPRLLLRSAARASTRLQTAFTVRPALTRNPTNPARPFSVISQLNMPDQLKSSEVNSKTDPSVAKQYDNETPKDQQIKDFFSLADDKKIGILNTYRNGVGT